MANNAVLQIVKGIQKTPGDTISAETGLDVLDLLDTNGFSAAEYEMKIPSLKSSAVYADSPLTDGRTLISGTLGNVTETIRVTLNAASIVQLAAMMSRLMSFKQNCNDFWDTFGQIEPVYIKNQVSGEPGPRYALLYDIDVAVTDPANPTDTIRDVTIVIEREYGWRGIAPGDNPKKWTIESLYKQKYNNANASLMTGNDHLLFDSNVKNRAEQNTTATGYITKNHVDIPAAKIPGDLPALVCVAVGGTVAVINADAVMIGKSTKRNTGNTNRTTLTNQYLVYMLNAADATVGTDTTLAADTGACFGISNLQRRSQTTFATATMQTRLTWDNTVFTANGFNSSVLRGRYALFVRARVSAASTTLALAAEITIGSTTVTLNSVPFVHEGSAGTGNTTFWGLAYLGQVSIPFNNRKTTMSVDGNGVSVNQNNSTQELQIKLNASRSSIGGSLYVSDLIMLPIDEGAVDLFAGTAPISGGNNGSAMVYDNTGYFTHGVPEEIASIYTTTPTLTREQYIGEISGSPIYLSPKVDNRLMFLAYQVATKDSHINDPSTMQVRVNIVPRWAGLRDV